MESRAERIEKIRKETDEEVRGVMEGSASLIPEVNPETLEEEEERNETAELYEAVAEKYRALYESLDLKNYFKTEDGKKVLKNLKNYIELKLRSGVAGSDEDTSSAIQAIAYAILIQREQDLYNNQVAKDWLAQAGNNSFKSNFVKYIEDTPPAASYNIRSLASIILLRKESKMFDDKTINGWLEQTESDGFKEDLKKHVDGNLFRGKINRVDASFAINTMSCVLFINNILIQEDKSLFKNDTIRDWLIQAGNSDFISNLKKFTNNELSSGASVVDSAYWAVRILASILLLSQSLSSEANRLRAEEYDKGKGKKVKPSSPRLPFGALAK